MQTVLRMLSACLASLSLLISGLVYSADKLPNLDIDLTSVSVSGLSSGAFMTSQFYIANSDIMVGAGIVAGGPYLCAKSWAFQNYLTNATTTCMNPLTEKVGPNTPYLLELTKKLAKENKIDALTNLADDRLYLFSGQADQTVTTLVVNQTEKYYTQLGVKSLRYVTDINAGHAIITADDNDTQCSLTRAPYINDCDFTQAWDMLQHIYGKLKSPSKKPKGEIIEFDQHEFIDSPYTSMSETAFAYVPKPCKKGGCRLHVVFHGCEQGAKLIGDQYYATTGYNRIADSNKFVMLYPQVEPSNTKPFNPKGCWDFWGYSSSDSADPDFFSKNAPQIKAVRAMVERLAQSI